MAGAGALPLLALSRSHWGTIGSGTPPCNRRDEAVGQARRGRLRSGGRADECESGVVAGRLEVLIRCRLTLPGIRNAAANRRRPISSPRPQRQCAQTESGRASGTPPSAHHGRRGKALWRRCRRRADQVSDPRVRSLGFRSEVNLGDGGAVGGNVPRNGTEVTHSGSHKIRPSGAFDCPACSSSSCRKPTSMYERRSFACARPWSEASLKRRGLALVLWQPAKTFRVEQP